MVYPVNSVRSIIMPKFVTCEPVQVFFNKNLGCKITNINIMSKC